MTSPDATLKTVWRRDEDEAAFEDDAGSGGALAGGGGGGTEKSARSCASVSRISEVMSWFASRALVKILGGGNLVGFGGPSVRWGGV